MVDCVKPQINWKTVTCTSEHLKCKSTHWVNISKLNVHHFALQALTAHYVFCKIPAEAIEKVPMQIKWSMEVDDGWRPTSRYGPNLNSGLHIVHLVGWFFNHSILWDDVPFISFSTDFPFTSLHFEILPAGIGGRGPQSLCWIEAPGQGRGVWGGKRWECRRNNSLLNHVLCCAAKKHPIIHCVLCTPVWYALCVHTGYCIDAKQGFQGTHHCPKF